MQSISPVNCLNGTYKLETGQWTPTTGGLGYNLYPRLRYLDQMGTMSSAKPESGAIPNEIQQLEIAGDQLKLTGANTVTLPTVTTYTAGPGISLNNNNITNTGDKSIMMPTMNYNN
ncbi:MAG: hypothetical protein IPN79_12110 [Saprospiraceae bacterium]|nr:hypothetical protein [Saprospiraceae bacterium]